MTRTAACEPPATAAEIRSRAARCQDDPSAESLRTLAEALARTPDPGAAARDAGTSLNWLARQSELAAEKSAGRLRGSIWRAAYDARDLFLLRRALTRIGVPVDRWPVSGDEITEILLQYARSEYRFAVRHMHPGSAWRIFVLRGERCIPALDSIEPGAHAVVLGYAVRYLREALAGDDRRGTAPGALTKLRKILPDLDGEAVTALEEAGIPVNDRALEHAVLVCETRDQWNFLDNQDDAEDYYLLLKAVCKTVLADRAVRAAEIGVTEEEIWRAARDWTAAQARRAREGDYTGLRGLVSFLAGAGLGCGPFGLTENQVARWERNWAAERWDRAQDGDGRAAFNVFCHCEEARDDWEQVTGRAGPDARAALQKIMTSYVLALKKQVEQASSPKWAEPPFDELKRFMLAVQLANDSYRHRGMTLITLPWTPSREEWKQFCDRYLED